MSDLTPRQRDVLEEIERFIAKHDYPPTMRELAKLLGTVSTNTISEHLDKLEAKGFVKRAPLLSRSLRVLKPSTTAAP